MSANRAIPQIARRHHYIPEFYLKRWASSSRKGPLVEFSKPYGDTVKPKRVHPRETGFVDRLYEMRGVPPEQSQRFETEFFAPVDTKAATVLQKMEAGETWFADAERTAWSDFLMSLVLRHPENVAAIREHMMANIEEDRAAPGRARWRRGDDDPATVAEVLRQLGTEDGIATIALNTLVRSIKSKAIGTALINTEWGVLPTPLETTALLTSDRPLLWAHHIRHPEFHLLLPIGPKAVFYAVNPGSKTLARLRWLNDGRLTEFMNEHVTRRAARYVYALGDQALPYVQARMGVDPRPTLIDQLLDLQRMRDDRRRKKAATSKRNGRR